MIHDLDRRIRPPRLGTIGLGIKVGSDDKERPQEVRYFVVGPEIAKVYGEQSTRLPVRFPWNEPGQVLHSIFYVQRKGRVKVRQCDGRMFTEIRSEGKDVCGDCPKSKDPDNLYAPCEFGCRATARLSVLIPKTRLGIWEVRLGGLGRIADLMAELRLYRAAIGPLSQFPFEIERLEVEEQYFSKDGPRWRKGYPVRLRSPYTIEEVAALHEAQGMQPALSPAPQEEDVVDADEEDEPNGAPRLEDVQPLSPVPLASGSPAGRTDPPAETLFCNARVAYAPSPADGPATQAPLPENRRTAALAAILATLKPLTVEGRREVSEQIFGVSYWRNVVEALPLETLEQALAGESAGGITRLEGAVIRWKEAHPAPTGPAA